MLSNPKGATDLKGKKKKKKKEVTRDGQRTS